MNKTEENERKRIYRSSLFIFIESRNFPSTTRKCQTIKKREKFFFKNTLKNKRDKRKYMNRCIKEKKKKKN